jgi:hypothetical protein
VVVFSSRLAIGIEGLIFTQKPVKNPLIWDLAKEQFLGGRDGILMGLISVRRGLGDYLRSKLYKEDDLPNSEDDSWIYRNSLGSIGVLFAEEVVIFPYTEHHYNKLLALENQVREYEESLGNTFSLEDIFAPSNAPNNAPKEILPPQQVGEQPEPAPESWEGELSALVKSGISLEPEEEFTEPQKKRRALAVK